MNIRYSILTPLSRTISPLILPLIASLWLTACGGAPGGGTTQTTTPPAQTPPARTPTPTPTPTPTRTATPTPTPTPTQTLSFSANPTSVASGGSTTLTWSFTNVTSCTASGNNAWSGSKNTSGKQTFSALTATSTYTLTCTGKGGSVSRTVTVSVGTLPPVGAFSMPTLEDERKTYRSWGWTWAQDKEPGAVTEPLSNYDVRDPDIHGSTEGDDLWTYLKMYQRTGNTVYLNRAKAWARYFKEDYRNCVGGQYNNFCYDKGAYGMDHMYGWGLVAWYEYTCSQGVCDTGALTAAENLASDVEVHWSTRSNGTWPVPGQFSMSNYGTRDSARHTILAAHLAEVTKNPRWIALRNKLTDLWMQSPDWDARGMYFVGEEQTDNYIGSYIKPGSYAAGLRVQSTFQIGILTEALFQAYRATGRSDIRDRIIAMARFIDQYGLDPKYQYTGSWFGVLNGKMWHNYSAGGTPTFWDPVYTTSLVNTLVLGYKFTGERALYERAKLFFNCGTKGVYGAKDNSGNVMACTSTSAVNHFVDTKFASDFWLGYNNGELQYTYLIFENGGQ